MNQPRTARSTPLLNQGANQEPTNIPIMLQQIVTQSYLVLENWVELPLVTPEHIKKSR